MAPERKIPPDVLKTPEPAPDRPSGSWPRRIEESLFEVRKDMAEIKQHLVGTLDRRGLVRRVEDIEAEHAEHRSKERDNEHLDDRLRVVERTDRTVRKWAFAAIGGWFAAIGTAVAKWFAISGSHN